MDRPQKAALPKAKSGFSKRQRLLKPVEFSRVFKNGRRLSTGNFLVYVLKGKEEEGPGKAAPPAHGKRLGVSVSSAVGNAVVRNRIKRLVREFFRQGRDTICPGQSADIVIAVKKSVRAADIKNYAGVCEELGILRGKAPDDATAGRRSLAEKTAGQKKNG